MIDMEKVAAANARAVACVAESDPVWIDVRPAGEFLGLPEKTILHAGPPIAFARMCPLHRRGMINACYMEGWAKTEAEATRLLESGTVRCESAYDYATDGSGTGIVTAHVPLLVVEDRAHGTCAGVFPHEGRFGGGFCGWGVYSPEIAENLRYLGDELFKPLVAVLKDAGGFPLRDLFARAVRMGDELHSCQDAIDVLFTHAIIPYALRCANAHELLAYFATTRRFTHNFGQAASRAALLAAERIAGSSLVTCAGGNGVEYGIKTAGTGARWFTAPSPMIEGPYLVPGAKRENQLPWIGDSSVTECRGWGGRLRPINPSVPPAGTGMMDVLEIARTGVEPVINGGMIDVNGGWMGAGCARIPLACCVQAAEAIGAA